MTIEQMRELFGFQVWADDTLLKAAVTVSEEGYYREQQISAGSLHKLLVHAMAAQWIWLSRWKGTSPTRLDNHTDYPTRNSLQQRWPAVHADLMRFLEHQNDSTLEQVITYHNTQGNRFDAPLSQLMLHLIDHGAYHRGQINTMIKNTGGKPMNVGYVNYLIERGKKK